MIFTHEARIPLSVEAIHLDEWLFNLSEADYRACARGHQAVGTNGGPRFEGMVNVESMAGALLVQHYRTEILTADHVRLTSEASQGYLMHVVPFQLGVGWEMKVSRGSPGEATLRCTIDVRNPLWVRVVGALNASNVWIRRHLIEETHGFARDITAKGGR